MRPFRSMSGKLQLLPLPDTIRSGGILFIYERSGNMLHNMTFSMNYVTQMIVYLFRYGDTWEPWELGQGLNTIQHSLESDKFYGSDQNGPDELLEVRRSAPPSGDATIWSSGSARPRLDPRAVSSWKMRSTSPRMWLFQVRLFNDWSLDPQR